MKSLFIVLAAVLIMWLLAGICCLFFCVRRREKVLDFSDFNALKKSKYGIFYDEIKAGVEWLIAQPREPINIKSRDGLTLRADLIKHPAPRGTVIFFHGYRSCPASDFSCGSKHYYDQGFDLLVVDQRAHGKSEGKYIGFGVLERYDCVEWVNYAVRNFGSDRPIYLAGMSMGATTVLMASVLDLPTNVKGIIADCGFTSPWDIVSKVIRTQYHVPPIIILPLMSGLSKIFAGYGFKDTSTVEAMRTNRIPVLIMHGTDDDFVPAEMSRMAYDACRCEKRIYLIPKADHGQSFLCDTSLCAGAISDFLLGHL